MSISVVPFGVDALERRVDKITMTNSRGHSVSVINYGAALQSVLVPDRAGKLRDVCLGFDSLQEYLGDNNPYFGATVGRVCNRIGGAAFEINGKTYSLTANEGSNTLHGGREGFNRKWWVYQTTEGRGRDFVDLYYLSHDGEEGFPGSLRAQVVYSFGDDDRLEISYRAESMADTPVCLTNHSYFNLSGDGDAREHLISVPASQIAEKDDDGIPTGWLENIEGTPYDLRSPRMLKDILARKNDHPTLKHDNGLDVSYDLPGKGLREAARLYDAGSGRTLTVYTTEPAVQVYTGQGLNVSGKGGARYGAHAGIALETQHHPDAVHHEGFDSVVLKAGESYHTVTVYAFGVT